MAVITITKDNFENEVLGAKLPVVLDSGQSGVRRVKCSHR